MSWLPGVQDAGVLPEPVPAHSLGQEQFSLQSPPQPVPGSYKGPFEQGQLTARWQRGWKEKFAAGGKKQIRFQEL